MRNFAVLRFVFDATAARSRRWESRQNCKWSDNRGLDGRKKARPPLIDWWISFLAMIESAALDLNIYWIGFALSAHRNAKADDAESQTEAVVISFSFSRQRRHWINGLCLCRSSVWSQTYVSVSIDFRSIIHFRWYFMPIKSDEFFFSSFTDSETNEIQCQCECEFEHRTVTASNKNRVNSLQSKVRYMKMSQAEATAEAATAFVEWNVDLFE